MVIHYISFFSLDSHERGSERGCLSVVHTLFNKAMQNTEKLKRWMGEGWRVPASVCSVCSARLGSGPWRQEGIHLLHRVPALLHEQAHHPHRPLEFQLVQFQLEFDPSRASWAFCTGHPSPLCLSFSPFPIAHSPTPV